MDIERSCHAQAGSRCPGDSHGQETPSTPLAARLGNTGYDDGFALSSEQATFSIAGNGYSVVIEFKNGFPFAQIFAPKDKEFIAIEPMTAATNALCSGEGLRVIAPGDQFTASFRIQVYHHARPPFGVSGDRPLIPVYQIGAKAQTRGRGRKTALATWDIGDR